MSDTEGCSACSSVGSSHSHAVRDDAVRAPAVVSVPSPEPDSEELVSWRYSSNMERSPEPDEREAKWRAESLRHAKVTSLGEQAEDYAEFKAACDYIGVHLMALADSEAVVRDTERDAKIVWLREQLEAALGPCDGGCHDYPEEDCSRHGRKVREVWEMCDGVNADLSTTRAELAAVQATLIQARAVVAVHPDRLDKHDLRKRYAAVRAVVGEPTPPTKKETT